MLDVLTGAPTTAAQAAPVTYTCPFPLVGNQTVVVATTADLPEAVTTGGPIAVTGLISQITFPATATQGCGLTGATTIEGTATRALGSRGPIPRPPRRSPRSPRPPFHRRGRSPRRPARPRP